MLGGVQSAVPPSPESTHELSTHVDPVGHAPPQYPQLLESVPRLTQDLPQQLPATPGEAWHALPQFEAPQLGVSWHVPFRHSVPDGHVKPQPPQFSLSQ
jgi:hypothetical protein